MFAAFKGKQLSFPDRIPSETEVTFPAISWILTDFPGD